MTRLKFRSIILIELALILLMSIVAGVAFLFFDLKSELDRQYTREHILVQQAFLEHKNEILNGSDDGFQNSLLKIANLQDIGAFKFQSLVNSTSKMVFRDLSGNQKSFQDAECSMGIRSITKFGAGTCFSAVFYWDQSSDEALLKINWWPKIEFSAVAFKTGFFALFSILLVGSVVCAFHWLLLRQVIIDPVEDLIYRFDHFVRTDEIISSGSNRFISSPEIEKLVSKFDHLVSVSKDLQLSREKAVRLESAEQITKQVVHDLKSPLTALKFAHDLSANGQTEEIRQLTNKALHRINDILSTILPQKKKNLVTTSETRNESRSNELSLIIESIISESRMNPSANKISFNFLSDGSDFVFASVDTVEIKRIISNLLANSIQSIDHNRGEISVVLSADPEVVEIAIVDNGGGIPSAIIGNLGERGYSYGKEKIENAGSGLGLYHAIMTVKKMGGSLEIQSSEGHGTIVVIVLPRVAAPDWFASNLKLSPLVISIDDDPSVHLIWKSRLEPMNIRLESFTNSTAFLKWSVQNRDLEYTALVDFDLKEDAMNGMILIKEHLSKVKSKFLVTTLSDDNQVLRDAEAAGIQILPKNLIGKVDLLSNFE